MTEPEAASLPHTLAKRRALRAIALFEAVKGMAALAAGIGLLGLVHHDIRHLASELIGHFGMHADAHFPSILLHYADVLNDANLRGLLLLTVAYATVRLLEAYGLWREFAWAEWLAALSGVLYIPFELHHMMHRPSVISATVLAGNAFVIGFLSWQLWRRRKRRSV